MVVYTNPIFFAKQGERGAPRVQQVDIVAICSFIPAWANAPEEFLSMLLLVRMLNRVPGSCCALLEKIGEEDNCPNNLGPFRIPAASGRCPPPIAFFSNRATAIDFTDVIACLVDLAIGLDRTDSRTGAPNHSVRANFPDQFSFVADLS